MCFLPLFLSHSDGDEKFWAAAAAASAEQAPRPTRGPQRRKLVSSFHHYYEYVVAVAVRTTTTTILQRNPNVNYARDYRGRGGIRRSLMKAYSLGLPSDCNFVCSSAMLRSSSTSYGRKMEQQTGEFGRGRPIRPRSPHSFRYCYTNTLDANSSLQQQEVKAAVAKKGKTG